MLSGMQLQTVSTKFSIICGDLPKARRELKSSFPFLYSSAFLYPGITLKLEQVEETIIRDTK